MQNFIKFRAFILAIQCPQNFGHIRTERPTDRYILKIVKSCSGHLKTCTSIENRIPKIFRNPILSSNVYRYSTKFLPKEIFKKFLKSTCVLLRILLTVLPFPFMSDYSFDKSELVLEIL